MNWLDWPNHKDYIAPNLDSTTIRLSNRVNSRIINRNELFSWKNYSELLQPAIRIFNNSKKFKDLIKK